MLKMIEGGSRIPYLVLVTGITFIFGVAGCGGGGTTSSDAVGPGSMAVKSGQKVAAPAPPDEKARAAGGSGMPTEAAAKGGSTPTVYVDAPADPNAQAAGGSGMPPIK